MSHDDDKAASGQWARGLLDTARPQKPWVILDTETTGLDYGDEIVQIAIVNRHGHTLLDALCEPERGIPPAATAIHGLTSRDVHGAPRFHQLYPAIAAIVARHRVLVYNAQFDRTILNGQCARYDLPPLAGAAYETPFTWECVMERYAAWVGDWSDHRQSYVWQKLPRDPDAPHSALADCHATRAILERMTTGPHGRPTAPMRPALSDGLTAGAGRVQTLYLDEHGNTVAGVDDFGRSGL